MSPNLNNGLFRAAEPVRPLQRRSAAMKNLCVLALVALIASCHFDKLFTGGGGTPFSHDPPAGLLFGAGPGNAQAGQPLNPVVVTVGDAAGTHPNGYTVSVDGVTKSITVNGSVTYNGLTAGNHSVGLSDVASNCVVSGQNPRTVAVSAGNTAQTSFAVTCTAPANQPPTAAFTATCNQLDCSFTSTSSDPDGTIASQQWNFGDNTTGSGAIP